MASRKATSLNPLCPHVANRRKAGFECDACIACPDQGFARHRNRQPRIAEVGIERDVRVRVNQSRQHGGICEINELLAAWRRIISPHRFDLVSFDHDLLLREQSPGLHVKQSAGADNDRLRRGRGLLPPRDANRRNDEAGQQENKRIPTTHELHSTPH